MRRRLLIVGALALAGCSGVKRLEPVTKASANEPLYLSVVNMPDPRVANQLLEGFYAVEGNAWRWTGKRFAVLLEPPPPVPFHRPALELHFTVPDVVIASVGEVTVTGSLDGRQLGSMTVSKPEEDIVFTSAVPSELIGTKPLRAEFTVDNTIPPSPEDQRELGVIVSLIALR